MDDSQHMVEHLGLQTFVLHPHRVGREEIEFNRQAMIRRLQLTDKKGNAQIAGIENAFVVKDDIEYGFGNTIPLWQFGFLY